MIYLDNNASTRLDPEAWAAMSAAAEIFGNPSSVHAEGQRARRAVEEARDQVAGPRRRRAGGDVPDLGRHGGQRDGALRGRRRAGRAGS